MEQTEVEGALKKLWKRYIKVKIRLAAINGEWSAKENIKLDSVKEIDEIVWYIEKESGIK